MSPLYLKDGKLLIQDGKLAVNQQCCCGGSCCMTGCVEIGTGLFMYSDTGQIVTNINEVPEIPGYLKMEFSLNFFEYIKVVPCPIPEEGSQEYIDGRQAFYDAMIASLPNNIELYKEFPESEGYWNFNYGTGEECSDTILDPKCTEIGGIWKPNQTCSDNPCDEACCAEVMVGRCCVEGTSPPLYPDWELYTTQEEKDALDAACAELGGTITVIGPIKECFGGDIYNFQPLADDVGEKRSKQWCDEHNGILVSNCETECRRVSVFGCGEHYGFGILGMATLAQNAGYIGFSSYEDAEKYIAWADQVMSDWLAGNLNYYCSANPGDPPIPPPGGCWQGNAPAWWIDNVKGQMVNPAAWINTNCWPEEFYNAPWSSPADLVCAQPEYKKWVIDTMSFACDEITAATATTFSANPGESWCGGLPFEYIQGPTVVFTPLLCCNNPIFNPNPLP